MSHFRPLRAVAAVVALVLVVSACSSEPPAVIVSGNDPATSAKDIVETLETQGFTIFASLIEQAGLTEELTQGDGDESITLFAPSDAAFADLGSEVSSVLVGEDDVYIVPLSDAVAEIDGPAEAEEQAVEESEDDEADVASTSGPEAAVPSTSASEVPGGAPTPPAEPLSDEATSGLLTAILEYHMVPGTFASADLADTTSLTSVEGSSLTIGSREEEPTTEDGEATTVITVDEADITAPDLIATNGVIHTVDQVLVPEDHVDELRQLIASIPVATDVLSTLRLTREHDQLVAAIEAAGLEADLAEAEAVTIFAPTDAAFDALTDEQRAVLEDPALLRELLLFHTVGRAVTEEDVLNRESVETLEGERVVIVKDGDTYTVQDVTIARQVPATNGVVYVIDQILVPESVQGPGGL